MKSYIWSLPTRAFHWLLAIGFTGAYILGENDGLRNLHFAFGAFTGILILFRLLFGLFGPRYSRFSDFPMGYRSLISFAKTYFSKAKTYVGHNPLAAVVMLFILIIGIMTAWSGFALYTTENGLLNLPMNEDMLEESHEVFANIFLISVIVHLAGVVFDVLLHKASSSAPSIFTGSKPIEGESVKLNAFHKVFAAIWFILPFYFSYLAYGLQVNDDEHEEGNKTELHESGGDHEDDDD